MGLPWEGNMNRFFKDGKYKIPSRDKNTASRLSKQAQKKNELINLRMHQEFGIRLTSEEEQKKLVEEILVELKKYFPKEKYQQLLIETAMTKAKLFDTQKLLTYVVEESQNLKTANSQILEKSKRHGHNRNSPEKISAKELTIRKIKSEKKLWEKNNKKKMAVKEYSDWVLKLKLPLELSTLKNYWYTAGIKDY
jgi:hypothetical protein